MVPCFDELDGAAAVRYIALDLEYTPETKDVWLIGARVVDPENGDVSFSCWSDREGNAQALTAISDLIEAHPGLAVVTYNGRSADLPMLRGVAERFGAERLMTALEERHLDLYHWLTHSLMLPKLDFYVCIDAGERDEHS